MSENTKNKKKVVPEAECKQCVPAALPSHSENLSPSENEKNEVKTKGVSYESAIKDSTRYFEDALSAMFTSEEAAEMISSWEGCCNNINNLDRSDPKVMKFFEVYCDLENYVRSQVGKDLGENITTDSSKPMSKELFELKKSQGLRQRIFKYDLGEQWLTHVTEAAIRCYNITKNEREAVELANLLLINSKIFKQNEFIYNNGIIHNNPFLLQAINYGLEQSLIEENSKYAEISEAIYEHQTNLMFRIYDFENGKLKVTQYSLPYSVEDSDCADFFSSDFVTQNAKIVRTDFCEEPRNVTLSQILHFKPGVSVEQIISQFGSVKRLGGLAVLEENDSLVMPLIERTKDLIDPFIQELLAKTPEILSNPATLQSFIEKYKQIIGSVGASIDKNKRFQIIDEMSKEEMINFKSFLERGGLISAAINGEDLSEVIKRESNGKVASIKYKLQGSCGVSEGAIGEGRMNKRIQKNPEKGDLVFFDIKNLQTGETVTYIECPYCHKGSVDVCKPDDRCKNCHYSCGELKNMYENRVFAPVTA